MSSVIVDDEEFRAVNKLNGAAQEEAFAALLVKMSKRMEAGIRSHWPKYYEDALAEAVEDTSKKKVEDFKTASSLKNFLYTITLRKCGHAHARENAEKRGGGAVHVSISDSRHAPALGPEALEGAELADFHSCDPALIAEINDLEAAMRERLPDNFVKVFDKMTEGLEPKEIAEATGLHEKKVRRMEKEIRDILSSDGPIIPVTSRH